MSQNMSTFKCLAVYIEHNKGFYVHLNDLDQHDESFHNITYKREYISWIMFINFRRLLCP